jgi:hypothetical protein
MVTIKVIGKLAFVIAIKEVCNIRLREAKDIADEIVPNTYLREYPISTFDPEKFGWTTETLKKICEYCNMYTQNVKIISYE